jgi:hypothetical protein
LFKTIDVTSEQQSRNRRDIEVMLGGCLDEVIDSFIPWKDISKAYFQAKTSVEPPKSQVQKTPVEAPKPSLTFGESQTVEFETDDEEEEERPRVTLGEDIQLDLFADEKESDEPELKPSGTMELNL